MNERRDAVRVETRRDEKKRVMLFRLVPMVISLSLLMITLLLLTGRLLPWSGDQDGMGSVSAAPYIPISPEEARNRLISGENTVLLDVRTRPEYEEQHIPGSLLIPLDALNDQIMAAVPDRETEIIIYCRSGRRSKEAASILAGLGYQRIFDLGGIINWPYEVTSSR